ncbi:MAG: glutamate/cysteine ligase, glutamate-cysteine ligase [Candidatus Peregrinibacteria bacterium GW2011_GWF2_33_10]|nr:MAG: glutamate/cysteine ligase, glutamate-cysteine ligase [Candidatus Peregrinibacteria bacterium GW2011_GWF2_33_10]OGJ45053.1 MAG: glutamate--cysteine ligase [Candidatus Peregrinibacteria bacterium RIFOXYA2_FULL_33_21]OGJ46046.1 MAG: glutamate--cysteine ligase [Candidatus Peregrinibacteria bacterium RIFOXYA12_FULL_33_12]OGJ50863.1 MAG: glutamate--cysteine ligase [Candidatus Peregrinibacteria bacterium RIFOXYB2_FULL_33_20]
MLKFFQQKFIDNEEKIQNWLFKKTANLPGLIYSSVDLRNSGFKIAAIDVNIFPAGWNNICPKYSRSASQAFKNYLNKHYSQAKKILIFPESHTKNLFYFENLLHLQNILIEAGFETLIGHNLDNFGEQQQVKINDKDQLILHKLKKSQNTLSTISNFIPDLIISNNDFSNHIPYILLNIDQPIIPNPQLGWFKRNKINNIIFYQQLITEFAELLDLDPWLFYPISELVEEIDFQSKQGVSQIAEVINNIIKLTKKKFNEYSINLEPYIFIKNASGTYGIGVESFNSVQEFLNMNRKQRNKLSVGKGSQKIHKVIIQEGIQTVDRYKQFIAEPVIYLVNNEPIGGFFRLNDRKNDKENLNSKGMSFSKLCFHEILVYNNANQEDIQPEHLKKIYYTLAQIASIAASLENQFLAI